MKKLPFIVFAITLFIGCSKDQGLMIATNENKNTKELAKPVEKVFKANFSTSVDPSPLNGPLVCSGHIPNFAIPARLLLSGNALHMGDLIGEESTLVHSSCNTNVITKELTIVVSGQITANNGDKVFYTGNDVIDLTDVLNGGHTGTIRGTWTITGGTGRFEGATGTFDIIGPVDFATLAVSFTGAGTIIY